MAVDRADEGDSPRHVHDRDSVDLDSHPAPGADQGMLTDSELRAAESRRYHAIADQSHAADGDPWATAVPKLRAAWEEHVERYPEQERVVPGTRPDGSWGTDTDRMLTAEQNAEATQVCAEIRQQGKEVIFPAMQRIEAADPQRYLAGLDHMLKGEDRLKEKAAERLRYHPDMTVGQAITEVPDAVRFTLAYSENRYTEGVRDDVERLKAEGFELIKLKNLWAKDQYKGINSQWRDPDTGLLIETQFHTPDQLRSQGTDPPGIRENPRANNKQGRGSPDWRSTSGSPLLGFRFRPAYSRSKTTHRRNVMADEISYYAIVDDHTSEAQPVGVLRRFEDGAQRDESFGHDLEWKFTSIRNAIEHGDLQYELVPITEKRLAPLIERMRARAEVGD